MLEAYDNFLNIDSTVVDISKGINESNIESAISSNAIGYSQTTLNTLTGSEAFKSSNFVVGESGWRIDGTGSVEFNNGVFRGILEANEIHIPSTIAANSFHTDLDGNSWWGAASRIYAPAYILNSGAAKFSNVQVTDSSTVGGRLATTIGGSINSSGNFVNDLINSSLNTSTKAILSDFNFGSTNYAGAVKAGTITWNSSGVVTGGSGVAIYRNGIVGANNGTTTFSIGTDGNATFKGNITGSTITGSVLQTGTSGWNVNIKTDQIELRLNDVVKSYWYGASTLPEFDCYNIYGTFLHAGTSLTTPRINNAGGDIFVNGHLIPETNNSYNIGNTSYAWNSIYLGASRRRLYDNSGNLNWDGYNVYTTGNPPPSSGVSAIYSGSGIRVNANTGDVKVTNTGVTSVSTGNNLNVNASTGSVTVAMNNDIEVNSVFLYNLCGRYSSSIVIKSHVNANSQGSSGGGIVLGGANNRWYWVNSYGGTFYELYKTTGNGFASFDSGVELQDGTVVSDVDFFLQFKEDKERITNYGKPTIDLKTLPKCVYKKATDDDGNELPRDKDDKAYIEKDDPKSPGKKKRVYIEDRENVFAMMSIMIGAIKELGIRMKAAESEIEKLKLNK